MAARSTTTAPAEVMTERELAKANKTDEVAIPRTDFDDDALLAIESFDDALGLLAEQGETIVHADEVIGNGFAILKDKSRLVGVELLFLGWNFNDGENGKFVSAYAIAKMEGAKHPLKYIINDGSTGLCAQLQAYTNKTGKTTGLHCKNGLTRSDYTVEIDGETRQASTFYLDTSA